MDDPGYADYQDPRLQPPDNYYHDPTPPEAYQECGHRYACKRVWCEIANSISPEDTIDAILALVLGCESCEEFDG